MIDKSKSSLSEVLSQIKDGATILIGGFGTAGQPAELIDGLIDSRSGEESIGSGMCVPPRFEYLPLSSAGVPRHFSL